MTALVPSAPPAQAPAPSPLACARRLLLALALVAAWLAGAAGPAHAQGVDLTSFEVARQDGELTLDFGVRLSLPRAVEDGLLRGVPVYFVAQASLYRKRWYWRDERIARITRSWRVAYQPLTGTWRVGLGGLNQSVPTLGEALNAASRGTGWRLADLNQLEPDERYHVEFSYRLDTTQLPGPMQIGIGGQSGWTMGIERVLRLD